MSKRKPKAYLTGKILYQTEYRNILLIFCFDKKSVSEKQTFCQNRLRICLKWGNVGFFFGGSVLLKETKKYIFCFLYIFSQWLSQDRT